ncbi:hypothetical protein DFH09DRAFT_1314425 [Mycena vulgaris]|nr:hypothetical protein DFH09DRAFT_1314425 [Mycena vulgaris]
MSRTVPFTEPEDLSIAEDQVLLVFGADDGRLLVQTDENDGKAGWICSRKLFRDYLQDSSVPRLFTVDGKARWGLRPASFDAQINQLSRKIDRLKTQLEATVSAGSGSDNAGVPPPAYDDFALSLS